MRIRKMVDASTANLPVCCRRGDWPYGIIHYDYEEGSLVWVPDEPLLPENLRREENEEEGEPWKGAYEALLRMQVAARKEGCDYIMFDRDGEATEGWEVFDGE